LRAGSGESQGFEQSQAFTIAGSATHDLLLQSMPAHRSLPAAPKAPDEHDPLWRMRAYRLAFELVQESWNDAEKLTHHQATEKVSGQLYAAIGSIAANLGEGYSHSSGRDRARIFEYALGSTRESMI
jgi:hypothetical protein